MDNKKLQQALDLCNSGLYNKAIPLFEEYVLSSPNDAEGWRNMAQAKMMLNQVDEAISDCQTALNIDPTNPFTLILMGNLKIRQNKVDEALALYEKALECHPDNVIALNNVGGVYMKMERWEDAIRVFSKAREKDDTYLNTYYAISYSYLKNGDSMMAFDEAFEGIMRGKVRPENPNVKDQLIGLMIEAAKACSSDREQLQLWKSDLDQEQAKLEMLGGLPVQFNRDSDLQVYAQMRYAKSRNRDFHEVVFNPQKGPFLPHLLMHELMHLEMYIEASKNGNNFFVVTKTSQLEEFKKLYRQQVSKLEDKIGKENANTLFEQLMKGILLQAMNCGLDMLVEHRIYTQHKELRPIQFLSLYNMYKEYVGSVRQAENDARIPKPIVYANKVMNIAGAIQLRELYGVDLVKEFKPTPKELREAEDLNAEYHAYIDQQYKPGEEYDFVTYVAETFDLTDFIELIPENNNIGNAEFHERLQKQIDEATEKNPVVKDREVIEEINSDFREEHSGNAAENMMMAMYMQGAMEYFDTLLPEEVRRIAMEIAVVGLNGISPKKSGYKVDSISGREFGGYEFLAYYYVSVERAIPELLPGLGLPFADAFKLAQQLYNHKHNKE